MITIRNKLSTETAEHERLSEDLSIKEKTIENLENEKNTLIKTNEEKVYFKNCKTFSNK